MDPIMISEEEIFYIYDVNSFLRSLDKIESELDGKLVVASHFAPTYEAANIARINREHTISIAELICEIAHAPIRIEDLFAEIYDHFKIETNYQHYALTSSTLRGYLAKLHEDGRIEFTFEDKRPYVRCTDSVLTDTGVKTAE